MVTTLNIASTIMIIYITQFNSKSLLIFLFLWSYFLCTSFIVIMSLRMIYICVYDAILVSYKDWGGDLEICRSILWANASAGAETLNFGKGSSDDERLNKTVVGSTKK